MASETTAGLTPEQVATMARGLYWLADLDGIEDPEIAVLEEFLRETGSDWSIDRIQSEGFDPRELPVVLETTFHRRLFLRSAVALIAADGRLSDVETAALRRSARLLGLTDHAYRELEEEARTLTLDVPKAGDRSKHSKKKKKV